MEKVKDYIEATFECGICQADVDIDIVNPRYIEALQKKLDDSEKENARLRDELDAINNTLSTIRKTVWKSAMNGEMTEEYKLGAIWVFHCLEVTLEDIKESKK